MDEIRARVLELLRRHGWNATSFQSLEAGFSYWFDGDDACVAYVETGGAWVVAGAPIAAPAALAGVAQRFVEAAARAGRRCAFFAAESRLVQEAGLAPLLVGEQPVWDPRRWAETVGATRTLREQLRRAARKGVVVRAVGAAEVAPGTALRTAVEGVIDRWLHDKPMAPMGFLVDVQPFDFAGERLYFVAEEDGRLVGFLAAVPVYSRGGWLIEDFLRLASAPNGTAELLIDAAMRAAAARGSGWVTLGLAPLSGPVAGWLRAARGLSRALYDFSGLRAFKAKLRPHAWEPIYVAHPPGASSHLALYDSLAAFARGSFLRFGAQTLLRGPAVVVRLLALLLIPWTVLLAVAPASWFPWPWVKTAWIGFDVVLVATLLSLTRTWRHGVAVAAAAAVSTDAALTLAEASVYNLPRLHGWGEAIALVVAIAGPALAAVVLWGALDHRRARRQVVTGSY